MIDALSNEPVNGRWLLTGIAGRGSSSVVYRAYDLVAEEVVAVKALARRRRRAAAPNRTHREFFDLARLRHPNLVETYTLALAETGPLPQGTPFFTMELLEPTGRAWAEHEPRSLARVALGLLAGLGCVHAHGLLHRDVKPSNVLLDFRRTGPARFKLSDLGLAAQASRRRAGLLGTLQYASPEAIAGERLDRRSDLYSLGVLLYEVATGGLPFDEADPGAALRWHLGARAIARDTGRALSPALARVIGRLMDPRLQERYATAREAWDEIADILPNEPSPEDESGGDGDGPFIGRRDERAALARWLESAWPTGGRFHILGPKGSGLSRLAREAVLIGQSKGWSVHAMRCAAGLPPFSPLFRPLREILLERCGHGNRRTRATIRGWLAENDLLRLLGGPSLWEIRGHALGGAVDPLAAALAGFLVANTPGRPLLIVLDDFDSADDSVRAVVREIEARARSGAPRLLFVTVSHGEHGTGKGACETEFTAVGDDASFSAGLRDPGRRRNAWRVGSVGGACGSGTGPAFSRGMGRRGWQNCELRLGGLSRDLSRALLQSLPCVSALTPTEIAAILRAAEGIPGRIVRLARAASGKQRTLFPPLYEPRVPGRSDLYATSTYEYPRPSGD